MLYCRLTSGSNPSSQPKNSQKGSTDHYLLHGISSTTCFYFDFGHSDRLSV